MNHRPGKYSVKDMKRNLTSHPDELKKQTRKMGWKRQLTDEQIQMANRHMKSRSQLVIREPKPSISLHFSESPEYKAIPCCWWEFRERMSIPCCQEVKDFLEKQAIAFS